MELNEELTAQDSLRVITETLNNSRKEIIRRSGRYYIIWGILLTFFSLLVYLLWKTTDNAAWNNLWFAMPAIGFPVARLFRGKDNVERAENIITQTTRGIWLSFCIFACSVALFSVLFGLIDKNPIGAIVVGASMTAEIVLLFGLAETITGFVLKSWAIKAAGLLTGIGGLIIYYIIDATKEQMFIFTLAGIVLVATGLLVKRLNR